MEQKYNLMKNGKCIGTYKGIEICYKLLLK